jgi:hypothetical protein
MKNFLAAFAFALCIPLAAQTTFDEMEFEADSTLSTYKPSGKNYVLVKSKRGTSGMSKTPAADAILTAEVSEIVLVFTENEPGEIAEREEANRERWENLLSTYPELFQYSTTYKNVCQCNTHGDAEAFKKAQGFYVYVNGEVPKVAEETKAEEPKLAANVPATKTEEKKAAEPKKSEEPPATKTTKTEEKKKAEVAAAEIPATKTTEVPDNTSVAKEEPEPEPEKEKPVAAAPKKKTSAAPAMKPRRTKDPKACRPACYGWGDEDLISFFKDNIALTKKEKKKSKKWMANVKIQLNVDGSIKKTFVTGENEVFNQKVNDAIKLMNNWNAAVKSGVTVKSEVKFTLKYDKEKKHLRPYDIMTNPKPSQKCQCMPDSQLFGD